MLDIPESWGGLPFFNDQWPDLRAKLASENEWQPVDPFLALRRTERQNVKVVIVGQDPYPKKRRATGLAFSFPLDDEPKHSLQNILTEVTADIGASRAKGDLTDWANQGVLLLNTVLTIPIGIRHGHKTLGWQALTSQVLSAVAADGPRVFILWGNYAKDSCCTINRNGHLFLESAHPSPISKNKGFVGSRPFSRANDWLEANDVSPIKWHDR